MPARAPASIDMLQTVMRSSMDMARIVEPAYSTACPTPPPAPILAMIARITGLHPWTETEKVRKVVQGRADARTTISDLQPSVQGGCLSPDPGAREDSRGSRRTAAAAAVAVHVARLLRTGRCRRARAAGAAAEGGRVGAAAGPGAAAESSSARLWPRRQGAGPRFATGRTGEQGRPE